MDVGGYILILIVAVCIIGLVVVARKRRELEKRIASISVDSGDEDNGENDNPQPEEGPGVVEEEPGVVTIYSYKRKFSVIVCPICDGENAAAAKYCQICGQKLLEKEGK